MIEKKAQFYILINHVRKKLLPKTDSEISLFFFNNKKIINPSNKNLLILSSASKIEEVYKSRKDYKDGFLYIYCTQT